MQKLLHLVHAKVSALQSALSVILLSLQIDKNLTFVVELMFYLFKKLTKIISFLNKFVYSVFTRR